MADIRMARIDFRLIHGQVVSKWIKDYPSKYIMIADDMLAADDFMKEIYKMALPNGVKLKTSTVHDAQKCLDNTPASVFLLFRSIDVCRQAIEAGVKLENLVVGGVPSDVSRTFITEGIYISPEEIKQLEEIENAGTRIIFKNIPEDSTITLDKVKAKMK